jgi:predicted XRE-type DNA-binding protein
VWREQFFDLLFAAQDADEEFDEEMFIWYDIGLALLMYISPIASE